MGQDTCIYVHKKELNKIDFFTVQKIDRLFSGRWYSFQETFKLKQDFITLKDFCEHLARTDGVSIENRNLFYDLKECEGFIMGDYNKFPEEKKEEDYVDLTDILYELWNKFKGENR